MFNITSISSNQSEYQAATRRVKREKIGEFIKILMKNDTLLAEFDEGLWNVTLESLTVHNEHELLFTFKDGTVIKA